jgi:hypothetical protein
MVGVGPRVGQSRARGRRPVRCRCSGAGRAGRGGLPERPKGTVLKTVVAAMSPWVQIPHPPPQVKERAGHEGRPAIGSAPSSCALSHRLSPLHGRGSASVPQASPKLGPPVPRPLPRARATAPGRRLFRGPTLTWLRVTALGLGPSKQTLPRASRDACSGRGAPWWRNPPWPGLTATTRVTLGPLRSHPVFRRLDRVHLHG